MKKGRKRNLEKTATHFIRIGRLLEQGYPLHTALTFIQLHVPSETKIQIDQVLMQLKEGHPVHEAFQSFDIPLTFKSFLYFYEEQGDLASGFVHAGLLLEKREKMRHEFMKLLRYPLFLLWLCLLLLILMYYLVVPHFKSFFMMMEEIPSLTVLVFRFLEFTPYVISLFIFLCIVAACYYWYKMKAWSSYQKVTKLLAIPYVGTYVRTIITFYFALQLGRLLDVGMSLQEALRLFTSQDYLLFFQQECVQIMHELHQGHSLAYLISEKIYFNQELIFVVENGEKTGYIAKDLIHYSEMLYQELDERLLKSLRYIQPAFFLLVGGMVFMLFLATMLPLFQMVGVL